MNFRDAIRSAAPRPARALLLMVAAAGSLLGAATLGDLSAVAAEPPTPVTTPKPTVPEIFTLQGEFVRMAYNNEGFVTLGYRAANYSIGQDWTLLEMGVTVRSGVKPYTLKREDISIQLPDGKRVPLATQKEYGAVDLRGLDMMASGMRDTINYFPQEAVRPCRLAFFSDVDGGPSISYDKVELNPQTACLGRLYFHVPGGLKPGQHWLHVKFAESEVQVPFRILTKEEEKELRKRWQDIKKDHEAATGQ